MSESHLHFITGKGGVGKSTIAAAFVKKLSDQNEGPILLIEIQGTGHSLSILGANDPRGFEIKPVNELNHVWGCRIMPKPSFRQYFGLLLANGHTDSTFAQLTSGLRNKFVDAVLENKVVSSFVDVCPGLEPAALLGKVHFECTEGYVPDSERRWKHVVVDAPATGHSLMLFRSTQALIDVFGGGVVFKQAKAIMSYMRNKKFSHFHIVTTPEELPLKEAQDLSNGLVELNIPCPLFTINRSRPKVEANKDLQEMSNQDWKNTFFLETERSKIENQLLSEFIDSVGVEKVLNKIPEVSTFDSRLNTIADNLNLIQNYAEEEASS